SDTTVILDCSPSHPPSPSFPTRRSSDLIHLIANNQVGFTTDPKESRSTDYASDLAKGFDAPIVHVNADDPEACLAAVRLAMLYRSEEHTSELQSRVDLVCRLLLEKKNQN